jgi:PhnB protein
MMKINAYLNFNGKCEEAFRFYETVLGGKIQAIIRYDEMPEGNGFPPELAKNVMHAMLTVDDNMLMGSDAPPEYFQKTQGSTVAINVDTSEEAERIFADLSKDAENVTMPIGETSWAQKFAMFTDRFGIPWIINCAKPGK